MIEIYVYGIELESEPGFTEIMIETTKEKLDSLNDEFEMKKFIEEKIASYLNVEKNSIIKYNWEVEQ